MTRYTTNQNFFRGLVQTDGYHSNMTLGGAENNINNEENYFCAFSTINLHPWHIKR